MHQVFKPFCQTKNLSRNNSGKKINMINQKDTCSYCTLGVAILAASIYLVLAIVGI